MSKKKDHNPSGEAGTESSQMKNKDYRARAAPAPR